MTTTNKSKKRSSDEDDFDILRQYILACPLVANPTENAAAKAALAGLDNELKRRERDKKLAKKFSASSAGSANTKPPQSAQTNRQDLDEEWQDIADDRNKSTVNRGGSPEGDEVEFIDVDGDTSFLGRQLAEVAIASIAESHVKAKTPLAAIAVALHAAMVSPIIRFACTGSAHDKDQAKAGGFAPPIRELPKTQFLPKDWDRYASKPDETQQQVVLRYRKQGIGSVLLRVEINEETSASSSGQEISVKVLPANTKEPPSQSLVFPLQDHINLDSWNAALRASSSGAGLEPAIHYKALPVLMTAYSKTFDLGSVNDEKKESDGSATAFIGIHSTEKCSTDAKRNQEFAQPISVGNGEARSVYNRPTIDNAFPQRPMFVGDFYGDLIPGGTSSLDPLRRGGLDNTGSLMGPNHPMFRGGGISGVGDGSGFGMRPRFDPFGPPGGPQEIQPPPGPNGRPLPPHLHPGASGDPNPDHLRPPNSLGGNMFC